MNLRRVKRAMAMFATMPNAMMSAVAVPYFSSAVETMASLFGTTPCTLNACWKMSPSGLSEPSSTPAPPPKTMKPRMVLMVPLMISATDFFCAISPMRAMMPTSTDGTLRISTMKSSSAFMSRS